VTDANQCTIGLSINVVPAAGPTISLASKKDVSCNGGTNGKIFTTTTGGTGPFTYTWSPAVSTKDSAVGLGQGSYTVVVHDVNGCTSTLSVTISQPNALSVSTTTIQASCGASDGSATASVTGGTTPYTYVWSVGASTAAIDSGLPAGSYTVIVTDSNNCTATATAAISNFGAPIASVASQINDSCHAGNNGKIVLSVAGGTPAYTYTWSPSVSTVDSAVNLIAGTYNITVHDATSCIAVVSTVITEPTALSATVQSANANCGQNDGWAQVLVSGGSGAYTYAWTGTAQTTDSVTGLSGGTYHVTVTDAMGCILIDSVTVGTNAGPLAPAISAGGPLTFCQGGSVVLTSSAATGNTWSNSATTQSITVSASGTFTVTQTVGSCTSPPSAPVVVTVNPIPAAPTITASGPLSFCPGGSVTLTSSSATGNLWSDGETSQSITVNTAGTYTVSDTLNTCPSPASAPVTVSLNGVPQPVIVASQPAICAGNSVTLDATTASATSYLWSNNANNSTQPIITVSTPGLYQVTVTVNGCTGTDTLTIYSQLPLGPLSLVNDSICQGDVITLDATTLNAATYTWSGPGSFSASTPTVTVDSQGVYNITVTNSCGSENGSVTIAFRDCDCKIVMPNAFTPNGDLVNDTYGPDFKCDNPKYLMMRIFNRWGEKVYETTDLLGQWDGKYKGTMQPPGVYVYYVEFTGLQNNVEKTFKMIGSVTVII
jgi:gliding motility-associated-like protein